LVVTVLSYFLPVGFLLVGLAPAAGQKGAPVQEFAIVGGTVFRDNGFALADAELTLEIVRTGAGEAKSKSKVKKLKAASSPRGEFTFRVPPVEAKYRVTASARGFAPQEKIVEVGGGSERVEVNFSLSTESKH